MIKSCDSYWKSQCESSGLLGENLSRERVNLGRYFDVATQLVRREHSFEYLSRVAFSVNPAEPDHQARSHVSILVEPLCHGFCLQYTSVVNPRLTLFRIEGATVSKCCHLDDIFPQGFFGVIWASSTSTSVLLYGNNSSWVEFSLPSSDLLTPPIITVWGWESSLISGVYTEFSMCEECLLVVLMSKQLNEEKLWKFQFLELRRNAGVIHHHMVTKKFLPEAKINAVKKTQVYSINSCSHTPSCQSHNLLVQFGSVIVQFEIRNPKEHEYEVSDPVNILCPNGDASFYCDVTSRSKFTSSQDKNLVGLIVRAKDSNTLQSHVWNLKLGQPPQVVDIVYPSHYYDMEYLALGDMYRLVAMKQRREIHGGYDMCVFLESVGSRKVLGVRELCGHYCKVKVHFCGDEQWLSSLSECTPSEVLCVSIIPMSCRPPVKLLKFSFK